METWLDLPDVSARRLNELLENGLTQRLEESVELLTRLEDAQRDLENVERCLAAAPKEDAIKDVAAELKAATSEAAGLRQQFNRIEAELKPAEFEVTELEKQITKLRHKSIDEQMSHDQNARVGALVRRTQDTMREFLRRATERKIARLSDLVTTSFRYLLRKGLLNAGVNSAYASITTRNVSEGLRFGVLPMSVNPSLTRFDVALFKTGEYQRGENKGNYHNPTRQRGIFGNTLETQKLNPSLTRRVGIVANAKLQN